MNHVKIFQNFDYHLMDYEEMEQFIEMKAKILVKLGFTNDDIFKIKFKDVSFRACFINEVILNEFENKFKSNHYDK